MDQGAISLTLQGTSVDSPKRSLPSFRFHSRKSVELTVGSAA
jgi:hypothetical protein